VSMHSELERRLPLSMACLVLKLEQVLSGKGSRAGEIEKSYGRSQRLSSIGSSGGLRRQPEFQKGPLSRAARAKLACNDRAPLATRMELETEVCAWGYGASARANRCAELVAMCRRCASMREIERQHQQRPFCEAFEAPWQDLHG
jgi:hypothetical protein